MNLLNGKISRTFAKAFAGIYLPATLHKRTLVDDGEGSLTATVTDYPCRAQVDTCGEKLRASAGYSDTDMAVYILQGTCEVEPTSQDQITTTRGRFNLNNSDVDPAGSYWLFRGSRG